MLFSLVDLILRPLVQQGFTTQSWDVVVEEFFITAPRHPACVPCFNLSLRWLPHGRDGPGQAGLFHPAPFRERQERTVWTVYMYLPHGLCVYLPLVGVLTSTA